MGKIFAQVINLTPLETRNKKDGSGTYQYADVTMQICDYENKASVHETFDWQTGESRGATPDTIRYDCVHDAAVRLNQLQFQIGEWILADVSVYCNKFGRNEVTVRGVERYQQQTQQPAQQQTRATGMSMMPGIR